MRTGLVHTLAVGALALAGFTISLAAAQAPAAQAPGAPAANTEIVVANPTYVSIPLEIAVDRPAAEVWKRVGKYCDIAEWLQIAAGCKILSGTDGEVGAGALGRQRSARRQDRVLVHLHADRCERAGPTTSITARWKSGRSPTRPRRLYYTLIYDNSMLPDDAAREKDKASRTAVFTRAIQNIKTLAEGGKLPAK